MKVLFVCRSNTGRSPCAEGFFNNMSKRSKSVSAGLDVKKTKVEGLPPGPGMIRAMKRYRIDISRIKRKQLTRKMVQKAGRVVVLLEKPEHRFLPKYLKKPSSKISFWSIKDPRNMTSQKAVLRSLREIRRRVKELVREIDT